MMVKNSGLEYRRPENRRYGDWAGNPGGTKEFEDRCVCLVHKDYHSYQCQNKRGFGPGGLYCKKHGRAAAIDAGLNPGGELQTVWVVERDTLASTTMYKETEKSFWVSDYKSIVGHPWLKTDGPNSRDRIFIYKSRAEAIEHLIARQDRYIDSANDAILRANQTIDYLRGLMRSDEFEMKGE